MTALKMHQENAARDRGKQYLPLETKSWQNLPNGDLDMAAARAVKPEEKGTAGGASPPPQGRAPRGLAYRLDDRPGKQPRGGQRRVLQLLLTATVLWGISLLLPSAPRHPKPPLPLAPRSTGPGPPPHLEQPIRIAAALQRDPTQLPPSWQPAPSGYPPLRRPRPHFGRSLRARSCRSSRQISRRYCTVHGTLPGHAP